MPVATQSGMLAGVQQLTEKLPAIRTQHPILSITPQKLDVDVPLGDAHTLVGYICDILMKYARFRRHEDVIAIALWIAGTWFAEPTEQGIINGQLCFEAYPRLFLIADPGSGKNRVMKIIRKMVRNPTVIGTIKVTSYGVQRALEDGMTVLIDEYHNRVGTQGTRNVDLQDAVRAYSRDAGSIDGKGGKYNEYDAFGPVVLAAHPEIESGNRREELQDLFDRSIIIRMEKHEDPDDVIPDLDEAFEMDCDEIRECMETWAAATYQVMLAGRKSKRYVPIHDMPRSLNARQREISMPLCFVADIAIDPKLIEQNGRDTEWAVLVRKALQVVLLGHGGDVTGALGRLAERYGPGKHRKQD